MRKLFRNFERFGVDYLLIAGQASVLYGASTFSEDVDLWIRPTSRNARRFLEALAACRARVYKLTPRLTLRNLRAGHGFHFLVPARPTPIYLDVLGRPPRVTSFAAARRRAVRMRTGWGAIPVVSIPDLIEMKKTRRLSDYEVISNLVRIHLGEMPSPSRALLRWAIRSSFRAEDRAGFLERMGVRSSMDACRRAILKDMARLQARDTAYWSSRVEDLRGMRAASRLLPEGLPVSALLKTRR